MQIEVKLAQPTDRVIFDNLIQFYIYDFTEFLPIELNEKGSFDEHVLERYFADPDKYPYLILVDGQLAGFVLVGPEIVLPQNQGGKSIKEFFIARKYRKQGVGKHVATTIFAMYDERWEIRVGKRNLPAKKFWENVIKDCCGEKYTCEEQDNELWRGSIFSIHM